MISPPPASVPDDPPTSGGRRIWTHGTLRYSLGALLVLFGWLLLGDFAIYLRDRSIVPITQLFLKREGAPDTLIAIMLFSLPALLGVVLAPVVSLHSDRHRGPRGRRIPYLLVSGPLAAAAMAGLAFSAPLGTLLAAGTGGFLARDVAVFAVFGLFWTVFGAASVVSMTIFNGLINDVVPTAVLGRFFGLFRVVSIVDAIVFNYFLLGWAETHFMELCLGISFVFGAGFLLMCLNVREGGYPPPEPMAGGNGTAEALRRTVETYFHDCYSKGYYVLCFVCLALGPLAFTAITSFLLLYAKQMGMSLAEFGKINALCAVVSLIITYPVGALADRFHPLRVAALTITVHAVVTALGTVFIRDLSTFAGFVIAQTVLSSCYYTATASLPQRLLPRSKFLQFFSAANIVTALFGIGFGPALGLLLDATGNAYRVTFLVSTVLSLLTLASLFFLWRAFKRLGGPAGYVAPGEESVPA
jgi:MFS family permease